jgi:hypothetical protein
LELILEELSIVERCFIDVDDNDRIVAVVFVSKKEEKDDSMC